MPRCHVRARTARRAVAALPEP
ncbi:hypothetical protein gp36 [Burkholderia phage KS9]|nr:hypothetical protein gp36 [Burkholderia phage KS9]ACT83000.1 hypothetical protein gp36 [Burkholderia phage KS9]